MLEPGTILQGKYVIDRVLGQGGMGTVYLARQTTLGDRLVAIKETTLTLGNADTRQQAGALFRKEAEILASIEHPNLVDVKDYFEEGDSRFIVMAFVDGETLDEVLERSAMRLRVDQVLGWTDQVCEILTVLHEHNPPVFVRDLKPSNIMLDQTGRIRLIDFGIARVGHPDEATSPLIKGVGTSGFAPVEQLTGSTDGRSDLYALGATVYTLVSGARPPSSAELAAGHVSLTPPSQLNPAVSPQLDAVISRLMSPQAEARYQTVREARKALAAARATVRVEETAQETVAHRRCLECGAVIVDSVGRCPQCWKQLLRDEPGPDPAPPAPAADPSEPADSTTTIAGAVIAAIILVILAGWLWRVNSPRPEVGPTPSTAPSSASSETPTPPVASTVGQNYFPLASGCSWKYRTTVVSTGAASEWTMKVLPAETSSQPALYPVAIDGIQGRYTEWYSNADGWVLKHRIQYASTGFSADYVPVMKYLENPLTAGSAWDWKGTGGAGQGSHRDRVVGAETIEVPAGKFDCQRVQSDIVQAGQSSAVASWWAPGIGCVQSLTQSGGLEYRSVLVEYDTHAAR